jgi:hypothetical protein
LLQGLGQAGAAVDFCTQRREDALLARVFSLFGHHGQCPLNGQACCDQAGELAGKDGQASRAVGPCRPQIALQPVGAVLGLLGRRFDLHGQ